MPRWSSSRRRQAPEELGGDNTNWFSPSVACLEEWCASAGLRPIVTATWPEGAPTRAMVTTEGAPGKPEFAEISFEVPSGLSRLRQIPRAGADVRDGAPFLWPRRRRNAPGCNRLPNRLAP